MTMQIIAAHPPNFSRIAEAFPHVLTSNGVIYCYGSKIYSPDGILLVTPELVKHESIHSQRQGQDVDGWWDRYITDMDFRLREEIPAHKAEYFAFCRRHGDRNIRAKFLSTISERLAGPLYGSLLTVRQAKNEIMLSR